MLDVVVSNQHLNLSKRDADVALRATDRPPDALIGRRIAGIAWAVYGPAGHPAESFDPAVDARRFNWIGPGDGLAGLKPARWLRDHVGEARIVYKVNTIFGLAQAVAAGIGLTLLPCFIGDATPGLRRLAPPDPGLEAGLWHLTHPDLRRVARIRAFLDFAADWLASRRALIEGHPLTSIGVRA